MALSAKIYPLFIFFTFLMSTRTRTRTSAGFNSNITVINLFPDQKDIRCPMRFMAIRTGQDIASAKALLIGRQDVITAIAGRSASMLFHIPINMIEVSSQHIAVDSVRVIVTVSAKSNIVSQVGAILGCGTIRFKSSVGLRCLIGIFVHPLG